MPVCVSPDRSDAAARLARHGCDVILSDDGLQHYLLWRDLEVVVVDAQRGFGNGRTLPAGPLREPRARLEEVDCVVTNGAHGQVLHPHQFTMELRPLRWLSLADQSVTELEDFCPAEDAVAISGIGNPQRFFSTLAKLGVNAEVLALPDHYDYRPKDLGCYSGKTLLMTAKDAIKCRQYCHQFDSERWFYLEVEAVFNSGFYDHVGRQLQRLL